MSERRIAVVTVSLEMFREALGMPESARILFAEQDMGDRQAGRVKLLVSSPDIELVTAEGATPPALTLENVYSECAICGEKFRRFEGVLSRHCPPRAKSVTMAESHAAMVKVMPLIRTILEDDNEWAGGDR